MSPNVTKDRIMNVIFRWRKMDVHDIVENCARLSLDVTQYHHEIERKHLGPLSQHNKMIIDGAAGSMQGNQNINGALMRKLVGSLSVVLIIGVSSMTFPFFQNNTCLFDLVVNLLLRGNSFSHLLQFYRNFQKSWPS